MSSSIAKGSDNDNVKHETTTTDEVDSSSTITTATQQQNLKSLSLQSDRSSDEYKHTNKGDDDDTSMLAILTLQDITEATAPSSSVDDSNRNSSTTTTTTTTSIPKVKFIDDIPQYIQSFIPQIVTAELLIGAYTQLHTKYKLSETSLLRKQEHLKEKVPELQKSLLLVQSLIEKQQNNVTAGIVRYNLVDSIYARAEIDYTVGIVYLWLGANVMLEYTYDEAIQFLQTNFTRATTELQSTNTDLSFIRDQIVTSEVNISRIYNYDVRQKRDTSTKS